MSTPPSGDSDVRSPEDSEGPPEEPSLPSFDPALAPIVNPTDARAADAKAELAFYEAEVAAHLPASPKRAAVLVHEVAWVREHALGLERDAAKSYAHSLTLDPSFEPNAWALRRIFVRRGLWDNLLRVLDAQIRFVTWSRPSDRADLQVERGRILEDRLARDDDAVASYRAALVTAPDHPGALWSLLASGWRRSIVADVDAGLSGLLRVTAEPSARAVLAIELARWQRLEGRGSDPDSLARAADTLLRALSAGADPTPVLRELDRLSLVADKVEMRLRYLDAFESRVMRAPGGGATEAMRATMVSYQREKARILQKRGARDAAFAVLERALRMVPAHRIVLLDFLDAADEAGRADAIVAMLEGPLADAPAEDQAEALLRRAEIAEKSGALGEAIGTLERIPAGSPLAPLAELAKMRVLARLQDADGLARAFVGTADRLEASGAGADKAEAAHLLVRAAVAWQRAGTETAAAEALLRRALALVPDYGPAAAALAAALARGGRFGELAAFVESQSAPAGGALPAALREGLVLLHRDILIDGAQALRHQRTLLEESASDPRAHLRTVDVAGLAGPATPGAIEAAVASLDWLAANVSAKPLAASFRILAARLLPGGADDGETEKRLRLAFDDDPSSTAAAALEWRLGRAGRQERQLETLIAELRAAEQAGSNDRARALRYRLAFAGMAAGRTGEALAHLEPLRRAGDRLAAAWSLDLSRQADTPRIEAQLLRELAQTSPAAQQGDGEGEAATSDSELDSAFERTWALGEALEQAGEGAAAAEALKEASARAAHADPARWADVELGIFRSHVAQDQHAEAVASLRRLALVVDDPASTAVRREAALSALSADLPDEEEPGDGGPDGVWHWLKGVRSNDARATVTGLEQLAKDAAPGEAASALWASVAMRKALLGDPSAPEALARARGDRSLTNADVQLAALAVAATDLMPAETPATAIVGDLRRARIQHLSRGSAAQRGLAEGLLLDEALEAECAGRVDVAAEACAQILALRPESLEATEGLRRAAQVAGDRLAQAAALARRGTLLSSRRRAAESYAEAALLLQEEGLDAEAAALFLEVLSRTPHDDEAYHRLHDILDRRDDSKGLERLLSFKLRYMTDSQVRLRLLAERARLRLGAAANRNGAIEDLRRVLAIDPHHLDTLQALGELAQEDRRFGNATHFFQEALTHAPDRETASALRAQLAEAFEAGGNDEAAANVLSAAVDADPDDDDARERVVALAIRRRDLDLALSHLSHIEGRAKDAAARAKVLLRIGRLERDHREDRQRALAAFRTALILDPLGDAAGELASVLPGGAVLEEQDRLAINTVVNDIRHALLETDPLDVRRLECLRALARLRGMTELAEVAGQLLGALGVGHERGRARDLTRALPPAALTGLMAAEEGVVPLDLAAELWPLLGEAAARLEGLDAAPLGATRHNRVAPGAEPRLAWLEAAAVAIGLPVLTIYVTGPDDLSVAALDAPEPTLLLGRGLLGGDAASRFRAGRALFLLRQRAAVLDRIDTRRVDEILRAATLLSGAHPPGVDPQAQKASVKALARAMPRKEARALEAYRSQLEAAAPTGAAWHAGVIRGANRFGLLVAGDLAACVRVLCGRVDPTVVDLRQPDCLELIRFAMGDWYSALRRDVGLAATGGSH